MDLLSYLPQNPFAHKDMLSLMDYTSDEVLQLLSRAARLKILQKRGVPHPVLAGKSVGLYLAKPSTRTRISFEVGLHQLGAQPVALDVNSIGMGSRESLPDIARVLSRFLDGLMIRTFSQADINALGSLAPWSVINGLTDDFHPCQALADMLTVHEVFGQFSGVRMCYVGDGNNVTHSLMLAATSCGMDITIATPKGYEPSPAVVANAQQRAAQSGAKITFCNDPREGVRGANIVYTDVWASMGQEDETAARAKIFADYQINGELMTLTANDGIFMHCLPAHRGSEVTDEVMDAGYSLVFDQAENRLHAQKGVMAMLMGAAI